MQTKENHISCPECGHHVDVNDILYRQLDAELNQKYTQRLAAEQEKLQSTKNKLDAMQLDIQAKEQNTAAQISAGVESRINTERTSIAKVERAKAEEISKSSMLSLEQELADSTLKLKELSETKAAVLRIQREKDTLKATLDAENEQRLNKILSEERLNIQIAEANKSELKIREKENLIETLNKQLIDAQRKAEQGSMQSQGEAQELAVEAWLQSQFPQDNIDEIKKGANGGDCIQTINTTGKINHGSIYYESKRTKAFQPAWIEKFKTDIRESNCSIGVLVSQARPTGMERMGLVDGIWVCNFDEFKGLCQVLRSHIIQLDQAVVSQENKGDKMALLYQYLQSNEFRMQVEAIVEGFTQMKTDLDKEKRSIQGSWKKRETQINKVLQSTTNMYGAIHGIAGSSIQPVAALEFDSPDC